MFIGASMASDLWNIALNVIAAFVYAAIVWLWKNRGRRPEDGVPPPNLPPIRNQEPIDHRAYNRQAFVAAAQRFLFYLVTFGVLYLSITMPPLFKALFAKEQIMLSEARHIGEYLPSVPVGKDYLQIAFFIAAATLYWPMMFLAEGVMSLLYPVLDMFRPVTPRVWSAATMLIFLAACIPVAATSIWLFYPKSYSDSLVTVLVFIVLAFVLGQAQGGRR